MSGIDAFISREKIAARVGELGAKISRDYAEQELTVVPLLNGAFMFSADLVRAISNVRVDIQFMAASSYVGDVF